MDNVQSVYPFCCRIMKNIPQLSVHQLFKLGDFLDNYPENMLSHPYLADLARIEAALYALGNSPSSVPEKLKKRIINPNLELIEVRWKGLPGLLQGEDEKLQPAHGFVVIWQKPAEKTINCAEATSHDLLALKIITEQISSREAALRGGVSLGTIDDILYRAEQKGLLLSPPSSIFRPPGFPRGRIEDPKFFTTQTFTLQWHITQTCDLHCRHCYDRSIRSEPDLDQCIKVLDQLYDFCQTHHVFTQVTFTGGNPLLYPHFNQLYRETVERGFLTAILGNPMPKKRIEEICEIQIPEFYQVSLEGLRDHNDYIRGKGHFERVLTFLDLLREMNIYSMVMLTLTQANLGQVLDLAEVLRDKVDLFTFNRLAMVGEGAELASVPPEEYRDFLKAYLDAATENPCIGLKDNLINVLRLEKNQPFFGGCAGRGCGAAFNFVALLSDGQVHACRKFPSPIGNLNTMSLEDIYHGDLAKKYRSGSQACANCLIRPVCGGCLAVTYGFGLDIFTERDPYCCIDTLQTIDE